MVSFYANSHRTRFHVEHRLMARVNSLFDATYIAPTNQLEPSELEKLKVSFQEQVQVLNPETGEIENQDLRDGNSRERMISRNKFKKELTCLIGLFAVLSITLIGLIILTFRPVKFHSSVKTKLVEKDESSFQENYKPKFIDTACSSFPCLNNGICENIENDQFICICVGEWYGRICDTQVNFDKIDWSLYGIRVDDKEMLGEIDLDY